MNKKETAEAIEVMQAYVDGAEIEGMYRSVATAYPGEFRDDVVPDFNWMNYEYRIKSAKPREFWLAPIDKDSHRDRYVDCSDSPSSFVDAIKVREI